MRLAGPLASLLLLAGCVGPMPGSPEACAIQKLADVPVVFERNWPIAEVSIDGHPLRMVIDTGGNGNALTEQGAKRAETQTDWNSPMMIIGVSGYAATHLVKARTIAVGAASMANPEFIIVPFELGASTGHPVDGLIGAPFLGQFDIDFDFPNQRITIYRGRACPDGRPPWTENYTAAAPSRAWNPTQQRPFIDVNLDGFRYSAMLDTGSQASVVTKATATAAGVSAVQLAADPVIQLTGVTPDANAARVHRFGYLRIGSEELRGIPMAVTDNFGAAGGLIGADYLLRHRVWISFPSRRIFIGRLITGGGVSASPPDR